MREQQWKMKKFNRHQTTDLYLVASPTGLKGIYTKPQKVPFVKILQESSVLEQTVVQLQEYFSGQRKQFGIPLDLQGTDFQKQVWKELSLIPFGKTVSYKDVARRIKRDKAFRAVGTANGKNPVCIVIPCHRVIAADGTLGGYSGGLEMKKNLLSLEGHNSIKWTV